MKNKDIKSFEDLDVYQTAYQGMLVVMKDVIPDIPFKEKFDLTDQLSRSSKAIPRLIAEGYAKRHQKMGFRKYIDDAMAEANETIVSLNQYKDLYMNKNFEVKVTGLIDQYDKCARQLYKLGRAWSEMMKF